MFIGLIGEKSQLPQFFFNFFFSFLFFRPNLNLPLHSGGMAKKSTNYLDEKL
jgi:hypothetical protein